MAGTMSGEKEDIGAWVAKLLSVAAECWDLKCVNERTREQPGEPVPEKNKVALAAWCIYALSVNLQAEEEAYLGAINQIAEGDLLEAMAAVTLSQRTGSQRGGTVKEADEWRPLTQEIEGMAITKWIILGLRATELLDNPPLFQPDDPRGKVLSEILDKAGEMVEKRRKEDEEAEKAEKAALITAAAARTEAPPPPPVVAGATRKGAQQESPPPRGRSYK